MRVRIKESSFCLRALRATLASFRMAAARSALAHVPTTSSAGLIRELSGTRANCRRAGKDRQRDWGLQSGEGRGGWSREVLTPSAGDDVDCCDIRLPFKKQR